MFSLFDDGITQTTTSKFISITDLVGIIRNNPNAGKIESIRNLRKNEDKYYKKLKSQLPNITPVCMVRERNLSGENLEKNLIQFSQYLYYDIDHQDPGKFKDYFVKRYGQFASLICISSSAGGISVLFRVRNQITTSNFTFIWQKVRETILADEIVDNQCIDIGRAIFISHDPSVFYNYENEIEIDLETGPPKKRVKQSKTCEDLNFTLNYSFSVIAIDKVLEKLITSTVVPVANPIVDFKPVECIKVYIQSNIKDGTKHKVYTSMIHALAFLNPDIEKEYIFSFMWYVNNRFAKPGMEKREFVRLFNTIISGIKENGISMVKGKIKYVHFNPECNLTKKEKTEVANYLNGCKRKNDSIDKIINAKTELEVQGLRITQRRIAEISGLSLKTVQTQFNSRPIDIAEVVEMINNSFSRCQDGKIVLSGLIKQDVVGSR